MAVVGSLAASGGMELGGEADVAFVHGSEPVTSGIVVEWDFDNDGDFDLDEEDVTGFFVAGETSTGRDWPSQLTGKAGPGRFKAQLRNDDNRFSHFNLSSPLNQGALSLTTGRKLRVRTADAANPDPTLLARDRFQRVDGPLAATETGQTWEWPGSPYSEFAITNQIATATSEDLAEGRHINVIDVGVTDYYVQLRTGRQLIANFAILAAPDVGVIFRYLDANNYQYFAYAPQFGEPPNRFTLVNVVAGVVTLADSFTSEGNAGMSLGVLVSGTTATPVLDGVVLDDHAITALQASATRVGMWGDWDAYVPPEVERFDVWEAMPATTEGILWTGDVDDIKPTAALGPNNTASLSGTGWLARLATHRVTFPGTRIGRWTGQAIGKVLADSNLLHPPGEIDQGTIFTGAVGFDELDAIEVARRFEETEYGFLHEAQEGWLNFEDREARAGRTSQATFSDDPAAQFSYHSIDLLDWRREVFNQVQAGVAPTTPSLPTSGSSFEGNNSSGATSINAPSSLMNIEAGDLLIAFAICGGVANVTWKPPVGWQELTGNKPSQVSGGATDDNFRIFAKVCTGTETSPHVLGTASANVAYVVHVYLVKNWFGDVAQGVVLSEEKASSDPVPISLPWHPQPAALFMVRIGRVGTATVANWGQQAADGWTIGHETFENGAAGVNMCIQSCWRTLVAQQALDPAPFEGTFSGFSAIATRMIAIRGFNGDPPIVQGSPLVTVNDVDSQERHNAVKSYINAANLYADETDAEAYGEAVLNRHADDRPVVQISFYAHTNAAYRNQAIRRRVGHRITLVADNTTGQGISGDFFIEHISHRFDKGGTWWEVTWQLSPA